MSQSLQGATGYTEPTGDHTGATHYPIGVEVINENDLNPEQRAQIIARKEQESLGMERLRLEQRARKETYKQVICLYICHIMVILFLPTISTTM